MAAIQRTDSAIRLNLHFHVLAMDGVCLHENQDGPLVFFPLPTPTRAEIAELARRTAERSERILRAHGRRLDPEMQDDEPHPLCRDEPGLAACYAAAAPGVSVSGQRAGQPTLRLLVPREMPAVASAAADADEPVAEVRGINVHAKELVDGRDRKRLERLCRYITRPAVAQARLVQRADGRLALTLKSVWRDGTRAVVFEPFDLMTRLVAAVPPPRFHLLRYFGVWSSHSSARADVVPKPVVDPSAHRPPPAAGVELALELLERDLDTPAPRQRWAWLLAHVFQADLETCPLCGGPMRWLEVATSPDAMARLLAAHGLGPQPPQPPPRRPGRQQLALPFVG